jgi:hypothetical protein
MLGRIIEKIEQVLRSIITIPFMILAIAGLAVLLKDDEDLEEDWEC